MAQEVTDSNLEDNRLLLTRSFDALNKANQQRHDAVFGKLQRLEERTSSLIPNVADMKGKKKLV